MFPMNKLSEAFDEVDDEEEPFSNVDHGKEDSMFVTAREGDHLLCPFQCDFCHFINMKDREPNMENAQDVFTMRCIRRANLDAFWSRRPGTVYQHFRTYQLVMDLDVALGFGDKLLPSLGPFPLKDTFGMTAAVFFVARSLMAGRNQGALSFGTTRKMRTFFGNVYQASAAASEPKTLVGLDNSATRQTADPTKPIWHGAFIRGARRRMGDTVSPDLGISIEVLLALLMLLEDEWNETNALEEQTEVVEVAFMCVVSFMLALRGNEIMIIHLGGLIEYLDKSTQDPKLPHVLVTLKGRLKGDMIDRYHAMPMAIISASGIKGELWTRRFVETRARQGVTTGYAFRRPDGSPARATDYEPGLHSRLCELVSTVGHLLPKLEDIEEKIRFRRSFRRGSNTQAQIKNVPTNVINAVARWSDKERSRGVDVHRPMQEHYLEMKSALPIILSYSGSL